MTLLNIKLSNGTKRLVKYRAPTKGTVVIGGRTYPTVKIGNQWWLAENLKYHTQSQFYYPNGNSNLEDKYGLLYNYDNILEIKTLNTNGFRLPSIQELSNIVTIYDTDIHALQVNSPTIWDGVGTNTSKFSSIPSGSYNAVSGKYQYFNEQHIIWSDTFVETGRLGRLGISKNNKYYNGSASSTTNYFSIRLVKDAE